MHHDPRKNQAVCSTCWQADHSTKKPRKQAKPVGEVAAAQPKTHTLQEKRFTVVRHDCDGHLDLCHRDLMTKSEAEGAAREQNDEDVFVMEVVGRVVSAIEPFSGQP